MNWSLSGLSDQRLLAAGDHEGGQIIGQVAGQAIADETVSRWWS